jgi:SAM-dependent methyltransferase
MKPLHEIYKQSFFGRRYKLEWRVPIVCGAVLSTFNLSTGSKIIDVGCATGDFLKGFYDRGYIVSGIEGAPGAFEYMDQEIKRRVVELDLRKEIKLPTYYDFCFSLEVAEHIEPEFADQYVDNLCGLSDFILISAASPGQGGHYHVNCQPSEYWEDKFIARGYMRSHLKENIWRREIGPWRSRREIRSYYHNSLVFRRIGR